MMQQCPNGHLYDDAKNSTCPYCNSAAPSPYVVSTVPVGGADYSPAGGMDPINPTVPLEGGSAGNDIPVTTPLDTGMMKTVDLSLNDEGILPITGWLICLAGKKKGEDFKIRGEQTTIGRGASNNIQLDFDASVSSSVNAVIAYDRRKNNFFIAPRDSKNNIYINDSLLLSPIEIHDYDVIEIGETKLLFRSLCNERFVW